MATLYVFYKKHNFIIHVQGQKNIHNQIKNYIYFYQNIYMLYIWIKYISKSIITIVKYIITIFFQYVFFNILNVRFNQFGPELDRLNFARLNGYGLNGTMSCLPYLPHSLPFHSFFLPWLYLRYYIVFHFDFLLIMLFLLYISFIIIFLLILVVFLVISTFYIFCLSLLLKICFCILC